MGKVNVRILRRKIKNAFFFANQQSLSLDDPRGSGDHENIYGRAQENIYGEKQHYFDKIHDANGKIFNDCVRKAVNIRAIQTHTPWHS